jgi:hypothetical protein
LRSGASKWARWSAEGAREPAAAVGNADDAAAAVEQGRLAQDIGGDILAGTTSEFVQHRTSSTEDSELRGRPAPRTATTVAIECPRDVDSGRPLRANNSRYPRARRMGQIGPERTICRRASVIPSSHRAAASQRRPLARTSPNTPPRRRLGARIPRKAKASDPGFCTSTRCAR